MKPCTWRYLRLAGTDYIENVSTIDQVPVIQVPVASELKLRLSLAAVLIGVFSPSGFLTPIVSFSMPRLKLCQCHICSAFLARDPDTNQEVPGVVLQPHKWAQHQQAFARRRGEEATSNGNDGAFTDAVMATTLLPAEDHDPVLISRSEEAADAMDIDPADLGLNSSATPAQAQESTQSRLADQGLCL